MIIIGRSEFERRINGLLMLISEIRFHVGGIAETSSASNRIARFEPDLKEAKDGYKYLLQTEWRDDACVVIIADGIEDLEEEFREIKEGCPVDA